MKTFREFVGTNEHLSENVFDNIKNAATMYRLMTGIDKFPNFGPFKAPKVRGTFKTPLPTPKVTRVSNPSGNPISATIQALTNLQGSTPQSGPAAERARANREAQIQQRYGDAMNQTPSRFGKAGPDVTRPKGMSNIPPAEAKPGSPSYVPPTRSVTTERPKPKPTGPVTSAQAIASGSKEGQGPKSAVSTYRDKADTKGLSVGRYKTLAQHRAAVAAQKAKGG